MRSPRHFPHWADAPVILSMQLAALREEPQDSCPHLFMFFAKFCFQPFWPAHPSVVGTSSATSSSKSASSSSRRPCVAGGCSPAHWTKAGSHLLAEQALQPADSGQLPMQHLAAHGTLQWMRSPRHLPHWADAPVILSMQLAALRESPQDSCPHLFMFFAKSCFQPFWPAQPSVVGTSTPLGA